MVILQDSLELMMLKYNDSHLNIAIFLTATYLVLFTPLTHAADQVRDSSSDEHEQIRKETSSVSSENLVAPLKVQKADKKRKWHYPKYLSLSASRSKINLIKQKENELKKIYNSSAVYPKQTGHHWNLSELSDTETVNLCYSLWLGLTFSEIEEIDKTDLPSQLYSYCRKPKRKPIGNINYSGNSSFHYNIVYPYTEKQFSSKPHRISVLICICSFVRKPKYVTIFKDSHRKFFAHKLKDNEYLILTPASKEPYMYQDLKIIDVQELEPVSAHFGDKTIISISTDEPLDSNDDEFYYSEDQTTIENQAGPSAFRSSIRHPKALRTANQPTYLSLTVPQSKIDLIIQKEVELKNYYNSLPEYSKLVGHIWDISELSENEAVNVCYSLWSGLKFSEIDDIDKAYLPPQLYSHCKHKMYPIGDNCGSGPSRFRYSIVYPHIENDLCTKHPIGVLQCICRFTCVPKKRIIANDSNRKFFAHHLQYNEYIILSPVYKTPHSYQKLSIIDVQEIDPILLHSGDKMSIPVGTNE